MTDIITLTEDNDTYHAMREGQTIIALGGDDAVASKWGNTTLSGGDGNDALTVYNSRSNVFAGDIVLDGGSGNDVLSVEHNRVEGNATATLNGGAGNDTLTAQFLAWGGLTTTILNGGEGDDTYVVDFLGRFWSAQDGILYGGSIEIVESAYQGVDEIRTVGSFFELPENVENLTGTSPYGIQELTGNELGNVIRASNNGNTLLGGDGNDHLIASGSDNTLYGDDGDDILTSSEGNDLLDGGAGDDTMSGGNGDDIMIGGDGDDTYFVANVMDVVVEDENGGVDTINTTLIIGDLSKYANVENIIGTGDLPQYLIGNSLANTLTAYATGSTIYAGGDDTAIAYGDKSILMLYSDNNRLISDATEARFEVGGSFNTARGSGVSSQFIVSGSYNAIDSTGALSSITIYGDNNIGRASSVDGTVNLSANGYGNHLEIGYGNSAITVQGDQNVVRGGGNDDFISAFGNANSLQGGFGDDAIIVNGNDNSLEGGSGVDAITINGFSNRFRDTVEVGSLAITGDRNSAYSAVISKLEIRGIENTVAGAYVKEFDIYGHSNVVEFKTIDGTGPVLSSGGSSSVNGDGNIVRGVGQIIGSGDHNVIDQTVFDGKTGFVKTESREIWFAGNFNQFLLGDGGGSFHLDGIANTIIGGANSDLIVGSVLATRIDSGGGDDAIDVTSARRTLGYELEQFGPLEDARVIINAGDGNDLIVVAGDDNAATIYGDDGNDNIVLHSGGNTVYGGDGDDSVHLYGGGNTVYGGNGNNEIVVEEISDSIFDFNLLVGGENSDVLIGGSGRDTLDGGLGGDLMTGGSGNDLYYVDDVADVVTELEDGGVDTVFTTAISLNLADNIELLKGTSDTAQQLRGNALDNTITADGTGNGLWGGDGNDILSVTSSRAKINRLSGGSGNDELTGGAGRDILAGDTGVDLMRGGAGADVFDFNAIIESGLAYTARDMIIDFRRGEDKIDLSTIDANTRVAGNNAFKFVGGGWFDKKGGDLRVWHHDEAGTANDYTCIAADVNGDAVADFRINLSGIVKLSAGDFIL